MKISIPYIKTQEALLEEQAAGFPPFSRGYKSHSFKPTILTDDTTPFYDFHIKEISPKTIVSVLETILRATELKPNYHLFIDIPTANKPFELTAVLRSLLAVICSFKTKNASSATFIFYTKNTHSKNSVIEYQFAEIAQINYLITNPLSAILLQSIATKSIPVDPLYGSKVLKVKTDRLFTEVWNQIKTHFTV